MKLRHAPTGALFFTAAIAMLTCAIPASAAGFRGPVGLQLYSLRAQFKKDAPGTFDEVKGWGVKYAEAYAGLLETVKLTPAQLKEQLESRGIKLVSSHFGYEQFRDDIDGVVRDSEAMGLKYAGCA